MKPFIYPFLLLLCCTFFQARSLSAQCSPDPCAPEITWPADYTVECGEEADPAITGYPVIAEGTGCNSVYGTVENSTRFTNGSGSITIQRDWEIIDYCFGEVYEHTQFINVANPDEPCEAGEVFFFDTYNTTDAVVDELFTPFTLEAGMDYEITVEGTYSIWHPGQWSAPCGFPESAPIYPSSGGYGTGPVGFDFGNEFSFPDPGRCSGRTFPNETVRMEISLDGGATWFHPAASPAYNPDHIYTYSFAGVGYPLGIRHISAFNSDDYGQLKFTVKPKLFVNQRTGASYENLQKAIDDVEADETIEIMVDHIDEVIEINNGVSFTLYNASGKTISVKGAKVMNQDQRTRLEGDDWSFEEVTFIEGWLEYFTDVFITRSFGGGDGAGWYPCQFCPKGEPIPGVNIALEQIPGGIYYVGNGEDEEGTIHNLTVRLTGVKDNGEEAVPAAARFELITREETPAVISQLFHNVPAEVRPDYPPYYVPFVHTISFTNSDGNSTGGIIAEMDVNIPTAVIQGSDRNRPTTAAEIGTPVAGNIHPDGNVTYYLGELMVNTTIKEDDEESSEGDNVIRFQNVRPASPFVLFGCPGCGENKVQICHVPPGNPQKAKTKCIDKESLIDQLNSGSYCGPCQEPAAALAAPDQLPVAGPGSRTDLRVFPNPAEEQLTVAFPSETVEPQLLRLMDLNGRVVRQQRIGAGVQHTQVDVAGLPAGVYVLRVQDGVLSSRVKVVVGR